MNKKEFIDKLAKKLEDNRVSDIDDIVSEYEEHFAYKLADGCSEEEIAAKLGDPEALAQQFVTDKKERTPKSVKGLVITGLVFLDIFVGAFYIALYASLISLAALAVSLASVGVCMIGNFNPYMLIPPMPYWCGAVMAASFIALAVLSAVGCVYFASFIRQLIRAYGRYCHNLIASASGGAVLPSVTSYPKLGAALNRRLRKTALISLAVFAV